MILVKLTEPVTKAYSGPGLTQIVVSGSYLTANAQDYVLGQSNTRFYFKIGDVTTNDSGSITEFKPFIREHINLTSEELAGWGTDDFAALEAIATKLNLEVESEIEAPDLPFTI
jgi:hypothetical protein